MANPILCCAIPVRVWLFWQKNPPRTHFSKDARVVTSASGHTTTQLLTQKLDFLHAESHRKCKLQCIIDSSCPVNLLGRDGLMKLRIGVVLNTMAWEQSWCSLKQTHLCVMRMGIHTIIGRWICLPLNSHRFYYFALFLSFYYIICLFTHIMQSLKEHIVFTYFYVSPPQLWHAHRHMNFALIVE